VSLRTALALGALLTGSAATAEHAAGQGLLFRQLKVADGLSDSRVQALSQDRLGFVWIATADGLDRYDGNGFRVFRHHPDDPASLGPGMPRTLAEGRDGALWVGLVGGGLSIFDPRTESFTHLVHDPSDPASLSNDFVETLAQDGEGAMWVGTMGGGLNRVDPATRRVTRYRHDPKDASSLAQDAVSTLLVDRSGALWVGTSDSGLDRLVEGADGSVRFVHFRHDPSDRRSIDSDHITSLLETQDGSLWVGTWDRGVQRLDGGRTRFTRVEGPPGGQRVKDLVQDPQGAVWIASWGGGITRVDPATGRFDQFLPDATRPGSLGHAVATSLLLDRNGLLWIGTVGGGLSVTDLHTKPFVRYPSRGPGALSDPNVRSVLADRRGDVWVGTAGDGLNRVLRPSGRVTWYRHDPTDPHSLADNAVWSLLEDREGTLWVGTYGGLDRLDRKTGRFAHLRHRTGDAESLSDNTVYALHEDGAGRLWVGTWNGLNLLDRRTGGFRLYRSGRDQQQVVWAISGDPAGFLWLSMGQQLVRFHPETGVFEPVVVDPRRPDNLGVGFIWAVKRDGAGRIWLGTSVGLVELIPGLSGAPARLRRFGPEQGLPDAAVPSIEPADGLLWLGTTQGLVRFDPERGEARRYDANDGLADESFGTGSFQTTGGEMFFGATGGLTSFRPDEIKDDTSPFPVLLTGVRLSHNPIRVGPGSVLQRAPFLTDAIDLPYGALTLTFEFAALHFRLPERNRFRYRLDGFDDEWHEIGGGEHTATYTGLRAGRYRFRVLGANADGVWSDRGPSVALWIQPPWWATWWFRGLAIACVAVLLFAAHRRRTRTIETRSRHLENEVRERQHAQEAAVRSERQLRLMADALPVMIAYVDHGRRIRFLNLASEEWSGRSRGELEGRTIEEVLPVEAFASVREPMEAVLEGTRMGFELNVGEPDARQRIAVTLVPHTDGAARTLGFYVLGQDITERVRTQEELHRRQDQIAHASRVSTLGEMASALAHELNQPLTAVLANAHSILRTRAMSGGAPVGSDVEETLRDIADDSARAGEIIRRMREFIRKGPSRRTPLDVNQAIRGVEALIHAVALEGAAALELDLASVLPTSVGDTIQVQQVVLNLVRNGIEAMSSLPSRERRMVIRSRHEGGTIVVTVEDSGPPLPADVFERLFVPFYTTKTTGLGMGLSISRSIIQAHGGAIDARRGDDRGLCVRFTLPVGEETALVGAPASTGVGTT
jgi:PAS domain S-box-containing protein